MASKPPILPMEQPRPPLPKKTLASVVGVACAALLLTNIPAEESGRQVKVDIAGDGTATVTHVRGKQYLRAYLDVVGVATACDGLTRDELGRPIKPGQQFTEAQCTVMLERALIAHAEGVMKCTPTLKLRTENDPFRQRFAATSLAYNVGVAAYCGSSIDRHFDLREWRAGCNRLPAWNKAGGRILKGLSDRRAREQKICLQDLA